MKAWDMLQSRWRRVAPKGVAQHVMNRGTKKGVVFHQTIDRIDFLELLADAAEEARVSLIAFTLMDTHFHLVLRPEEDGALSAYMQWLMNAHIRQYRRRYGGRGEGHIYQGRYKNVVLPGYDDVFRVTRYVEANARAAGLVSRAEDWPWCSLKAGTTPSGKALVSGDVFPRPPDWLDIVNTDLSTEELTQIAMAIRSGVPPSHPLAAVQKSRQGAGRPRKYDFVAATN